MEHNEHVNFVCTFFMLSSVTHLYNDTTCLILSTLEFVMLADPLLSSLTDEEGEMDSMDELPQHKVTDYRSV